MEDQRRRIVIRLVWVLATLVIVAGAVVAFFWFRCANENARRASCQSNIKCIALHLKMYADDYDDSLPPPEYRWQGGTVTWMDAIKPDSFQEFTCPSDDQYQQTRYLPWPESVSYGANSAYLIRSEPYPVGRLSVAQTPSETIMVGDCARVRRFVILSPLAGHGAPMNPPCNVATRHFQGADFAFADGHVKWLPASDWAKDDSMWDLR